LIAANDSQGTIHNPQGLDIERLIALKNAGKSVLDYSEGMKLARDAVIDIECDIWIPAARPDVIHEDNVHRLRTKLVVEGANIPLTYSAEESLHKRGVLCVPDFIANAGGVICGALEYQGASQTAAFQIIEEKLRYNTGLVLEESASKKILPRQAALQLAVGRVKKAMSYRRWSLFSSAPGSI
jgi:glutamate dehydrogenase (NAD(P)+)